jgi:hypothetical protein
MGQYTDEQLQADHDATGHHGHRITPEHIDGKIIDEQYWHPEGSRVTVCVLTLKNDFHVVGYSSSVSAENFDEEIGRKLAKDRARSKIWELEGYLLRQQLHEQEMHPMLSVESD